MDYKNVENQVAEARKAAAARFEARDNAEIVEVTNENLTKIVSEVGQNNQTGLANGEHADFFSAEQYATNPALIMVVKTTSSRTGRTFTNLYAAANRYYKVKGKKVGEHIGFINIGGLVRYHYDLQGQTPNAEGKVMNAVRVLNEGAFNAELESYKQPWDMLTQMLADKTITAKRSTDKLFHQRFDGQGRAIPDTYAEQNYMIYSKVA